MDTTSKPKDKSGTKAETAKIPRSRHTNIIAGDAHIRASQLQCIFYGGRLDSDIIGALCRLLGNGTKRRHCKIYKPWLYDALSISGHHRKVTKRGKDDPKRFTQGIDIYQYEEILLPIWIDKQCSSIAI